MLIHRSLERIRKTSCASAESFSNHGGTRVKCLLAVAAGILACSAALFLLAQAYTSFLLAPGPSPAPEVARRSLQTLRQPSPAARQQSVQARTLSQKQHGAQPLEQKTATDSVAGTITSTTEADGGRPMGRRFQDAKQGRTPAPAPGRLERQYQHPRTPSGEAEHRLEKFENRPPSRDLSGRVRSPGGWRQSQEGQDRHFAAQARHNERVLELEQRLRAALTARDAVRSEEALQRLLQLIGARSLGGLKWRGFCALTFGDWSAAARYYGEALASAPGDIQCRYNLALAQLRQGNAGQAAQNYRRLKSLAPQSAAVRRLAPYFEAR